MFQITGKEISGHNQKSPSPVKKQPNKKHTEFAHSFQKEHKTKHTHFTMTPRAKGLSGPQQIIYISTSMLSRLKGGARVFALFCPPPTTYWAGGGVRRCGTKRLGLGSFLGFWFWDFWFGAQKPFLLGKHINRKKAFMLPSFVRSTIYITKIYIYIYTYIHINIYIYMYIYICCAL
jgi:hypothetical protein